MPQSAMPDRKPKAPRQRRPGTSVRQPAPTPPAPAPDEGGTSAAAPGGTTPQPHEATTFAELPLPRALLDTLAKRDIRTPFPIQAATLPDALSGRDVLGRGRTGSGKTLAFGLALLARIAGDRAVPRRPRALVLTPTRELAQQVCDALDPYGRTLGLRLATVVGGTSIQRQIDALNRGVEVIVATPGRLTDLVERDACRLDEVRVSVLDEADQMADMGFLPAVSALLDQVAPRGQRLLFSATLDGDVDTLIRRYLVDPATHSVDPAAATITTMSHHLLHVRSEDKQPVITEIAAREGHTLLFVRTKHGADKLTKQLNRAGVRAAALHGGKTQATRSRTLTRFRDGALKALVATDVAARGIHVEGIDLVANIDPPGESKDYLHRSGRTARGGESGAVATLVLPEQRREMRRMMTRVGLQPEELRADPGGDDLARVTGARAPSGVPVVEPEDRPRARPGPKSARPGPKSKAPLPRTQSTGQPRGGGQQRRGRPVRDDVPAKQGWDRNPRRQSASTKRSNESRRR